ncbi:MAG: preprotein translocase subunit SecA [Planctomycetes bacterium]|nr:preprotein translocase subunit SecA [Planctomycetota bacterium]
MSLFSATRLGGLAGWGWRGASWNLRRAESRLPRIAAREAELATAADHELRRRSLALGYRARCREPLDALLEEAFALVRESARRTRQMRHFDVQLLGGMAMCQRSIAEMQTGEGKTLTATLPLYLYALSGQGALLATVNDYLARRDAEWMRPIYELLGLTVGVIETEMGPRERQAAYACDITYGTAKEFGFDFLRDRLLLRHRAEQGVNLLDTLRGISRHRGHEQPVQREPHFMLVDEADSVLLDDAVTPLVIAVPPGEGQQATIATYQWAAQAAERFAEETHYVYDARRQHVELTQAGRRLARQLPRPVAVGNQGMLTLYEFIERAIRVRRDFIRDRHFVVRDGAIEIVDEFTGRIAAGRQWRDGIHQAVEAQAGVRVTVATGQAARITLQEFFLRYPHLAGMTGTASGSEREMRRVFHLHVAPIPTNHPPIRAEWPQAVFGTSDVRWQAVVAETAALHAQGRPVLIGTRSIDKSELVSELLRAAGIAHTVLNARNIANEAEIVAAAGQRGAVTVATNMAGRGTDIRLGPGVAELGGIHVICTEMHDSARIDRQLIGRCGRQGDPGSFRQLMALDDELLTTGLPAQRAELLREMGAISGGLRDDQAVWFSRAQQAIERRRYRQRRVLMYVDRERAAAQRELGLDPYLDSAA